MKYAWKDIASGKVRTMNLVSGDPEQFIPKPEYDVLIDGQYKNVVSGTGTEEDPYVYEDVAPISELIGVIPAELAGKNLKLDTDELTLIEDTDENDKIALRAAVLAKAEKGRKFKELADRILFIIAGHNIDNNLDISQIASIKASNPEALTLLSDGQPYSAKAYIDAITPDEVVITQEELDHVAEAYAMFAEENPDLLPE